MKQLQRDIQDLQDWLSESSVFFPPPQMGRSNSFMRGSATELRLERAYDEACHRWLADLLARPPVLIGNVIDKHCTVPRVAISRLIRMLIYLDSNIMDAYKIVLDMKLNAPGAGDRADEWLAKQRP